MCLIRKNSAGGNYGGRRQNTFSSQAQYNIMPCLLPELEDYARLKCSDGEGSVRNRSLCSVAGHIVGMHWVKRLL